ncbi:hypothetical protein RYX36_024569 [Vicia faba]
MSTSSRKWSLVSVDMATEKKMRLDYARCLVKTTSMVSLDKVVQVMMSEDEDVESEMENDPLSMREQEEEEEDEAGVESLESNYDTVMNANESNMEEGDLHVPNFLRIWKRVICTFLTF